ncbi:MAG: hypothetical protein Kow0047_30760 [Anaerolineae bacterium]
MRTQRVLAPDVVDYRDRVSVVTWAVLFVLAAGTWLPWPEKAITFQVLGSPLTIELDQTVILTAILILASCSGTEAVVRSHPLALRGQLRQSWLYWILPAAVLVIAAGMRPFMSTAAGLMILVLAAGALFAIAETAIYHTIDRSDPHYHLARIAANAVAYVVTLALFLIIYRTRVRSLLSATVIMVVAASLAIELLRGYGKETQRVLLYAGIVGLVSAEATWALNYWRTTGPQPGLILLLIFYVLVGVAQQEMLQRLTHTVLLEYAAVTLIGLALITLLPL